MYISEKRKWSYFTCLHNRKAPKYLSSMLAKASMQGSRGDRIEWIERSWPLEISNIFKSQSEITEIMPKTPTLLCKQAKLPFPHSEKNMDPQSASPTQLRFIWFKFIVQYHFYILDNTFIWVLSFALRYVNLHQVCIAYNININDIPTIFHAFIIVTDLHLPNMRGSSDGGLWMGVIIMVIAG